MKAAFGQRASQLLSQRPFAAESLAHPADVQQQALRLVGFFQPHGGAERVTRLGQLHQCQAIGQRIVQLRDESNRAQAGKRAAAPWLAAQVCPLMQGEGFGQRHAGLDATGFALGRCRGAVACFGPRA